MQQVIELGLGGRGEKQIEKTAASIA